MLSVKDSTGKRYYHTDHIGSIRKITDEREKVKTVYRYYAFGKKRFSKGEKKRHSFTGREDEDEFGLMYYRARYYDPSIGRFISPDPFTRGPDDPRISYRNNWYAKIHGEATLYGEWLNPHNLNRYLYCNNNPIRYVDPLGEYIAPHHFIISYAAARIVGYGIIDSIKIGWKSVVPDFRDGSQDQTADQTRKHAMAGIKKNGDKEEWQTREEAIKANKEYVKEMIEKGGLDNLGNALHAVQDRYAKGHNFNKWKGFHFNKETFKHLFHDTFPSMKSIENAAWDSVEVISNYIYKHGKKLTKKPKRKDK